MIPRIVAHPEVGPVAGELLAAAVERVVKARGRCRLALSGGTTPVPVLQWLADHLSPRLVEALVVTWVDERHLPLSMPPRSQPAEGEHLGAPQGGLDALDIVGGDWRALPDESNLRLAWEHWFSRLSAPPPLVPMARPGPLLEAAGQHSREFMARLGGLDVVLLGVGEDGHIASLFPEYPAVHASGVCVGVPDAPKPPPERLTLTLSVLEEVEHTVLVATGAAKASMLRRALAGDASLPLGRYRPRGEHTWVLDPAAAAELPRP